MDLEQTEEYPINDSFLELTNQFIGLQADVFSYSPGFQDLYIRFKKENRYFLFKFTGVSYIKTHQSWMFQGFSVLDRQQPKKIFDREYFEVLCFNAIVVEVLNGEDVI